MINPETGQRELAYLVKIDDIQTIEGADRVETALVGGWKIMVKKEQFHIGDIAVYFEIDSKVPEKEPFMFLEQKHFKVKTQKYLKGTVISQGLLMSLDDFTINNIIPTWVIDVKKRIELGENVEHTFLTKELEVTYYNKEDNRRKSSIDKYKQMSQRRPDIFKRSWARWMMRRSWGRKIMFFFFGKKKDKETAWPVGKFRDVTKTDQERIECMNYILKDKTPFIVTEKCDGSSGTYILHRKKKKKFEFYVCSRNVRMIKPDQECYYDENYYWEVTKKYDIENKMKDYLIKHPELTFVCWQGEVCAPKIQKNPHKLTETHFYCFHMTDDSGRWNLIEAKKVWDEYNMETVPIVNDNYILPDDLETFKLEADGYYSPEVCEGNSQCMREGYVYYKTNEPTFSFKNVSRQYLLKHE